MPVSVGDVIRLTSKAVQFANQIQNVYHCILVSGTVSSDSVFLNDVTGHLENAYGYIDYAVADNVTWQGVDAWNLTDDEYVGYQAYSTLGTGGGTTNPMLPPQTAALTLFRTADPRKLGKKFLPPMTDNVLDDDGTPSAGALTNMANYGAQLVGLITGTGGYTFRFGTRDVITGVLWPYISAEARNLFATQRRRYTGKGI